jgi:hypothetical protein
MFGTEIVENNIDVMPCTRFPFLLALDTVRQNIFHSLLSPYD